MSDIKLPSDFDPLSQTFTIHNSYGEPVTANLVEVDYLRQYGIRLAINWGTQIGASIVLLVVLLLLTRRDKRTSTVFVLNALCLFLNIIRSILQCIWLTTNFFNPYALLSGDFSFVTSADRANSIASNVIVTLLIICIMVSLGFQVWTVCITVARRYRLAIMVVTTTIALISVGYRIALSTLSNIQTMRNQSIEPFLPVETGMYVTQAIAVWLYTCVFTFKLGYALLERKRLKMTQFGPLQIVFIMGCQTMIIPAIFTSLQCYDGVPELASQAPTIICIFLPLSAIWAGLVTSDTGDRCGATGYRGVIRDQFDNSVTPIASLNYFDAKQSSVIFES